MPPHSGGGPSSWGTLMLRRTAALLTTTSLIALGAPLVAPAAAQADDVVAPRFGPLPAGAAYLTSQDAARVRLRYACADGPTQAHYLLVQLTQADRPSYVRGLRGDTGGLLQATCTGAAVEQTVTLLRSSYADPDAAGLRNGAATLQVTLAPRSTPENGGWYVATGEDVVKSRTIAVTRTP